MRKTKITNHRLKMIIREELIRQALQQGILMERPFQGEPLSDFTDAVVQGAATTAVDQNATEEERKAAQEHFLNIKLAYCVNGVITNQNLITS